MQVRVYEKLQIFVLYKMAVKANVLKLHEWVVDDDTVEADSQAPSHPWLGSKTCGHPQTEPVL